MQIIDNNTKLECIHCNSKITIKSSCGFEISSDRQPIPILIVICFNCMQEFEDPLTDSIKFIVQSIKSKVDKIKEATRRGWVN